VVESCILIALLAFLSADNCVGFLCWACCTSPCPSFTILLSCPSRNRPSQCISSKSSGHCGLNIDFPRPQPRHDSLSYRLLASKSPRPRSGSPIPQKIHRCHHAHPLEPSKASSEKEHKQPPSARSRTPRSKSQRMVPRNST
jgi:hypothetical protein